MGTRLKELTAELKTSAIASESPPLYPSGNLGEEELEYGAIYNIPENFFRKALREQDIAPYRWLDDSTFLFWIVREDPIIMFWVAAHEFFCRRLSDEEWLRLVYVSQDEAYVRLGLSR